MEAPRRGKLEKESGSRKEMEVSEDPAAEMKEMEIETAGAGCSASRHLSASPAASRQVSEDPAMKEMEIETARAGGSWKEMEMEMVTGSTSRTSLLSVSRTNPPWSHAKLRASSLDPRVLSLA